MVEVFVVAGLANNMKLMPALGNHIQEGSEQILLVRVPPARLWNQFIY
jgi:hypothetical protein